MMNEAKGTLSRRWRKTFYKIIVTSDGEQNDTNFQFMGTKYENNLK